MSPLLCQLSYTATVCLAQKRREMIPEEGLSCLQDEQREKGARCSTKQLQ
jgi:hypothetical protein